MKKDKVRNPVKREYTSVTLPRASRLRRSLRKRLRPRQIYLCLGGVTVEVNDALYGRRTVDDIYRETYEWQERMVIEQTVQAGDIVLDLGGCLGITAAHAGKLSGEKVIIYEANPRLIPVIRRHLQLNKITGEIHCAAVGHEDGETDFYFNPECAVEASTLPIAVNKIVVSVFSFAGIISRHRPTYLCVDIEGGEMVLVDFFLPDNIRAINLETHPDFVGAENIDNLIRHLSAQGFIFDSHVPPPQFYGER